jgi:hypothetical protein
MHKRLFIDGFVNLKAEKPKLEEPLPFLVAQHDAMRADVMAMIRTFGSEGRATAAEDAVRAA